MKEPLKECSAKVHLFAGELESKRILLSAKRLHEALHKSSLHTLQGMRHGEFSINLSRLYAEKLRAIVKER